MHIATSTALIATIVASIGSVAAVDIHAGGYVGYKNGDSALAPVEKTYEYGAVAHVRPPFLPVGVSANWFQGRKDGDALGAKLPEVERRALEQQLQARIQPLLAKLQGESMRFPRPAKALLFLRPIVQVVTPRPRPDGKLPWLPEVPPLPPELGGTPVFPPGEPTPGSDPHGHGSDGHEHDQP